MADIDASVMKLLISTKQLLEVVTQWSRLEANEKQVSDIYVVLGNEFNKVTVMFQNAGIDMRCVFLEMVAQVIDLLTEDTAT